jgi:TonB family protein
MEGPEGQVIPPELSEPSPAPYPEALKEHPVSGTVQLELLIDETGAVREIKVAQGAHPAMDASATEAARKLRFKPGRLGELPVAVRLRYVYVFEAPPAPPPPTGTLRGEVRTKGTRTPIAGAALVGPDGLAVGETAADGRFEVALPPGPVALTVQAPGHEPLAIQETIRKAEAVEVVYRLEALVVDPYHTVVRGERERTELSRHTLSEQELREVPGTQGDPFRVVMLLPGVSSIASGVSYPVVRGAQPAATGNFIDGVRVPFLFHLLLGPAVVHPDFIDRLDFYPGVPPPQYGRILGGAIDASTSRPRDDRLHATAYADLINAGAFVEYPFQQTGTHVTVAGRISYTPWIVARIAAFTSQPDPEGYRTHPTADFYDYQARVDQAVPGGGKLRLLALGASDVVGGDSENPLGTDVSAFTRFHRVDLRYRHPLPVGEAELGATYGYEAVGLEAENGEGGDRGDYVLRTNNLAARAVWRYSLNDQWHFQAGADVDHRRSQTAISFEQRPLNPETGQREQGEAWAFQQPLTIGTFAGGHASVAWEPTPRTTVAVGVRADNYHLVPGIDRLGLEPRLTVRHQVLEGLVVKGGGGVVHQPPTVLLNLPVMDISGLRYGLQEAAQVDVGAEWAPFPGLEINLDAYYTAIPRAIEFDLQSVLEDRRRNSLVSNSLIRRGRAFGLELMVRHPLGGNWFGWVSYSYQNSQRLTKFAVLDESYQVQEVREAYLPFAFDQTHVVNAAVSYKFPGNLTVGAVVHFNTGRPESGQVSSRTSVAATDPITGIPVWRPVNRDQIERLPSFFRVDARIAKRWTFDDHSVEAYLDVLNALLSSEILAYDYTYQNNFEPVPNRPPPALLKRPVQIPIVVPMLGVKGVY